MLAHSDPDSVEDDPKRIFMLPVLAGNCRTQMVGLSNCRHLETRGLKLMLAEPVVGMVRGFRNRLEFMPSDFLDNQMRPW